MADNKTKMSKALEDLLANVKKNPKLWIAVAAAVVIIVVLLLLGGGNQATQPDPQPTAVVTEVPTAEPTAEPTEEPTAEPTAEPTGEPATQSDLPEEDVDPLTAAARQAVALLKSNDPAGAAALLYAQIDDIRSMMGEYLQAELITGGDVNVLCFEYENFEGVTKVDFQFEHAETKTRIISVEYLAASGEMAGINEYLPAVQGFVPLQGDFDWAAIMQRLGLAE